MMVLTSTFGMAWMYPFRTSKMISPSTPAIVERPAPRHTIASITKMCPKCRNGVPTAAGRGIRNDWIPRKITAAKKAVAAMDLTSVVVDDVCITF